MRYGPDKFQIKCSTVSSTGAFRDISQQVLEFSGFSPEAILEMAHSFGDTFEESLWVGVNRVPAITLGGFFDDDTSTGVPGIFGQSSDLGAERVFRFNFANTTGTTGAGTNIKTDVIVQSFRRLPKINALTRFELVVQPTGAFSMVTTT